VESLTQLSQSAAYGRQRVVTTCLAPVGKQTVFTTKDACLGRLERQTSVAEPANFDIPDVDIDPDRVA
jgi:hypothetical protein